MFPSSECDWPGKGDFSVPSQSYFYDKLAPQWLGIKV